MFAAATNPPAPKGANAATVKSPIKASPSEAPIPLSVFVIPKSPPKDGVDPFYPLSSRFASVAAISAATSAPPARAELAIKGYSGTPTNPLVIINDKTFAPRDQFEVTTLQGKVRVRCLEIRPNESAVIEVNGERRELYFRPEKK